MRGFCIFIIQVKVFGWIFSIDFGRPDVRYFVLKEYCEPYPCHCGR